MKIRVYEDRYWAGGGTIYTGTLLIAEIDVPNATGHYSRTTGRLLSQSDRCWAFPSDAPEDKAWGYHIGMDVQLDLDVVLDGSYISATVNAFDWFKVVRDPGGTPAGYALVRGNYSWYSAINGNEIHHYYGPPYAGEGYAEWYGSGGTSTFFVGPIRPQQELGDYMFGKFRNWVNSNYSEARLVFFNDLPPDYRPGAIRSGNIYLSHNRNDGEAHILNGSWNEMRTIGGGVEHDNIPSIRKNNSWFNQLKLGKE